MKRSPDRSPCPSRTRRCRIPRIASEANRKLETLKSMVASDVQVIVADRLSRAAHRAFSEGPETMAAKKPARKTAARKKEPGTTAEVAHPPPLGSIRFHLRNPFDGL